MGSSTSNTNSKTAAYLGWAVILTVLGALWYFV